MRITEFRGAGDEALIHEAWRLRIARMLMRVSATLTQLAVALTKRKAARPAPAELEFYAEAGAPEGALYVDGQRVALLQGITRL